MSSLHEECGIFGVYSPAKQDVARTAYYGLFALQHRGQESCGIVVCDDGVFSTYKDLGLVEEVFTERHLARLGQGNIAVGHVRYGTTGCTDRHNAQPLVVNHIHGHIAIAHNGNITNSLELRSQLELQGSIFHTTSDTEVISYIVTRERITSNSIEEAVERAMYTIKGSYSLAVMSPTKLVLARDPFGFRPLCYGVRDDGTYIAASETCALDSVGAKFVRDVLPGEVVYFDKDGVHSIKTHCGKQKKHICAFEFVYFARPDSVIDGISVHSARVKAGEYLAKSPVFRIQGLMPRSDIQRNQAFLTKSDISKTNTSAVRSSLLAKITEKTKSNSSSILSPRSSKASEWWSSMTQSSEARQVRRPSSFFAMREPKKST